MPFRGLFSGRHLFYSGIWVFKCSCCRNIWNYTFRLCIFVLMEVVIKDENKVIISERDVEIVRLLSAGVTAKRAAVELGINIRTFESKLGKLKYSFDCNTVAHLVATFIRKKLID
jgi:DNA-binding CsgD family transcriptional regulator